MEQMRNRRDYCVSKLEEHIRNCLADLGQDILLSKRQYSNHAKKLQDALEKADEKEEELIAIDGEGILRSKGLVNTREHLESLIESMTTGIATVQEYVESKSEPLESKTKLSAAENMS